MQTQQMEDFSGAKVYGAGAEVPSLSEIADETNVAMSQTAVESTTRAEMDMQIRTAHNYKRSVKAFLQETYEMACLDEETAEACFYSLPKRDKDGKPIEGPSIRLAEICASAWGNFKYGSRIVDQGAEYITAQGFAYDVQRNVMVTVEVMRRITGRDGRRYNADMIMVTSNAASSIARRNAVFSVIPRAYVDQVYRKAKAVAVGTQETLSDKRAKIIEHFGKMGIRPEQIYEILSVKGVQDITLSHLETLIGFKNAIRDNEISINEVFPDAGNGKPKVTGNAGAFEKKAEEPPKEEKPETGKGKKKDADGLFASDMKD
jgi:hypothetical protein